MANSGNIKILLGHSGTNAGMTSTEINTAISSKTIIVIWNDDYEEMYYPDVYSIPNSKVASNSPYYVFANPDGTEHIGVDYEGNIFTGETPPSDEQPKSAGK